MPSLPNAATEVLDFWLGDLDAHGLAASDMSRRWWLKDPALDANIRTRFEPLHGQLRAGLPDGWTAARARLAAVIVLDQFSRNMYRDTPAMFESDARALELSRGLVDSGEHEGFAAHERMFVYMPFMHSEALGDQQRCVLLFEALRDGASGPARDAVTHNIGFAQRHMEIVERFGRFPHRNDVLGRESTPEEREFLSQPGSSF